MRGRETLKSVLDRAASVVASSSMPPATVGLAIQRVGQRRERQAPEVRVSPPGISLNKPVRRIAVIGTGVIGASWTALYLARGLDVVAADPHRSAEAKLRHFVDTAWQALKVLGLSHKGSPDHLSFTHDSSHAVAQVDFVQECAPENLDLKIKLFSELDAAAPAEAIIASSSASLSISSIQSKCVRPERCLIAQ